MTKTHTSRPFGRAILDEWLLDPSFTYLNHGTVGVTPRAVLEEQTRVRDEIESNPARWMFREIYGMEGSPRRSRLREAADRVGEFVGARGEDLVFVGNATEGVNAVLGSLALGSDDSILITDTTYGAISRAARHFGRRAGAAVLEAKLPFPIAGPADLLGAVESALTPDVKVAIFDHIVSPTGVVLPIAKLAKLCTERGVRVLVDGAHAPGQLPLDIPALGVDWYVANLHKWAFAPRSCGILWATPEARSDLHPPVISWGLNEGFTAEFDWTGTRDPSPWLAAPAGLDFLHRLGFDALRSYNHDLAWRGASMLAARWNGPLGAPESMTAFMVSVPLPSSLPGTEKEAARLRDRLLQRRIEIPVMARADRLWLRLSTQVYNEMADIERLAEEVEDAS